MHFGGTLDISPTTILRGQRTKENSVRTIENIWNTRFPLFIKQMTHRKYHVSAWWIHFKSFKSFKALASQYKALLLLHPLARHLRAKSPLGLFYGLPNISSASAVSSRTSSFPWQSAWPTLLFMLFCIVLVCYQTRCSITLFRMF